MLCKDNASENSFIFVGFWKRVLASLIDLIILSPVIIIYNVYITKFGQNLIAYLLFSSISLLYRVILTVKYSGTIGKRLLKIRILSNKGAITKKQSVLRESIGILQIAVTIIFSYVILNKNIEIILSIANYITMTLAVVDVLVIPLNRRKVALHDLIAQTHVIKYVASDAADIGAKNEASCIFCSNEKRNIIYKGKNICQDCFSEIKYL